MKRTLKLGWRAPGEEILFGVIPEPATLRGVGGKLVICIELSDYCNVPHEFYVWFSTSSGTTEPWRVSSRIVVGTLGAVDSEIDIEQFTSYREAVAFAKRRARRALAIVGKAA